MKKGQEQLRVLMGGRGGGNGSNGTGGGGGGGGISRGTIGLGVLVAVGVWAFSSFYTVRPEEQSVELFLGEYSATGNPGLNFAPWPLVTAEVLPVTREQTEDIGLGGRGESGLMLTTDENIVDVDFQVVWNINDPAKFLFNLAEPRETIRAVPMPTGCWLAPVVRPRSFWSNRKLTAPSRSTKPKVRPRASPPSWKNTRRPQK